MPKLIILGTSLAIPAAEHENTHMMFIGDERSILVDCANNPTIHLKNAGLDILQVTDLILTHFHPDHVSGVPSFLLNSWLLGRKQPIDFYGLDHTLDRVEVMMEAYDWRSWPNFFPVTFHRLAEVENFPVLESREFRISSAPVCHMIPTIGLRVEVKTSLKVIAYSCDTEPCPGVLSLSKNADILIHEATGEGFGHSSPAQAGQIAKRAGAKELILIHYQAEGEAREKMILEAVETFGGPVTAAEDFQEIVI
jgi:ribonuclease Z